MRNEIFAKRRGKKLGEKEKKRTTPGATAGAALLVRSIVGDAPLMAHAM